MSTRNLRFFAKLSEFLDLVNELTEELRLEIILFRTLNLPQEFIVSEQPLSEKTITKLRVDRIYLSQKHQDLNLVEILGFAPGKLGWVQLDIPTEQDESLFISEICVKTDWYDAKDRIVYDNKDLIKFYNKIQSRVKKKLRFPVKVYNIQHPDSIQLCKGVGFTEGAKKFARQGGELLAWGGGHVRYVIEQGE